MRKNMQNRIISALLALYYPCYDSYLRSGCHGRDTGTGNKAGVQTTGVYGKAPARLRQWNLRVRLPQWQITN